MTSLITSQRDVKVGWIQEIDTFSAYMFWQVRNLRLPFHYYLPKFTFWQVCSLVVFVTCQNLILASMFVGRVCLFVSCQNLILASMFVGRVCLFVTCQNLILASMFVGRVCLFVCLSVCLYGNFTKSQERLNQSSPNLVISKHQSMIPASSLDKNVGQITRSRGQKLGQILKSS